jgi:hypothetical protein
MAEIRTTRTRRSTRKVDYTYADDDFDEVSLTAVSFLGDEALTRAD